MPGLLRFTRNHESRSRWLMASMAALLLLPTAAGAQTATPVPNVTTGQPQASFGQNNGVMTIKRLLDDGYEIKTGFVDPNGGAYLALQKTTSAYFCHSNPNPTCEKLN